MQIEVKSIIVLALLAATPFPRSIFRVAPDIRANVGIAGNPAREAWWGPDPRMKKSYFWNTLITLTLIFRLKIKHQGETTY